MSTVSQKLAQDIDKWLMSHDGGNMSLEQLMEVAGQVVAQCVVDYAETSSFQNPDFIVIVGKGNNGGDGLVAARALKIFGHKTHVIYLNDSPSELHQKILKQAVAVGVSICKSIKDFTHLATTFGGQVLVVDCVTGFGFTGTELKSPWRDMLNVCFDNKWPIVAVDVPSGWKVDSECPSNYDDGAWVALISLTYPKACSIGFRGHHYLGGRFLSPSGFAQFKLSNPWPLLGSQAWIRL